MSTPRLVAPERNPSMRRNPRAGFTSVELLIAIVVAGMLAAIAIPRTQAMLRRYAVGIAAEQLAGELQRTRIDAVRRNLSRTLAFPDSLHYQVAGGNARALYGEARFAGGAPATVSFDAVGRATTGAAVFTVAVDDFTRQVLLTSSGFARVQ